MELIPLIGQALVVLTILLVIIIIATYVARLFKKDKDLDEKPKENPAAPESLHEKKENKAVTVKEKPDLLKKPTVKTVDRPVVKEIPRSSSKKTIKYSKPTTKKTRNPLDSPTPPKSDKENKKPLNTPRFQILNDIEENKQKTER